MDPAKIYVGNLNYNTTEDELRDFFTQFGGVVHAKLISDFQTGRSKGFAFITFENGEQGQKAVEEANGAEFAGRKLSVNVAKEGGGRRDNR